MIYEAFFLFFFTHVLYAIKKGKKESPKAKLERTMTMITMYDDGDDDGVLKITRNTGNIQDSVFIMVKDTMVWYYHIYFEIRIIIHSLEVKNKFISKQIYYAFLL